MRCCLRARVALKNSNHTQQRMQRSSQVQLASLQLQPVSFQFRRILYASKGLTDRNHEVNRCLERRWRRSVRHSDCELDFASRGCCYRGFCVEVECDGQQLFVETARTSLKKEGANAKRYCGSDMQYDQSTFLVVNSSGCWSMAALFGIYICKQYFLILRICSFLIHKK